MEVRSQRATHDRRTYRRERVLQPLRDLVQMWQSIVELFEVGRGHHELSREDLEMCRLNPTRQLQERAIRAHERKEDLALVAIELARVRAGSIKNREPSRDHRGFDAEYIIDGKNELGGGNEIHSLGVGANW